MLKERLAASAALEMSGDDYIQASE